MPRESREPEKYSIDEMMERLQSRPQETPEGGELVTRADGTQAIRVRKRKRRSHQPHKEMEQRKRRARTFQVSAALGLVFITALGAGGVMVYANTSHYRQGIISKAAAGTGAEIEFREFRVNPLSAAATVVSAKWPEGNVLASLELRGATAELFPSSFLGKSWVGEEVIARDGNLVLRAPAPGAPKTMPAANEVGAVHFNRIACPNFRISVAGAPGTGLQIGGTDASFYPVGANGVPQLRINAGQLKVPGWPSLRIDRSHFEFRGDQLDVVSLRLLDPKDAKGTVTLSGTCLPYASDKASNLSVEVSDLPLATLIGTEAGNLISGRIDSRDAANSNFLAFSAASQDSQTLSVAFRPTVNSSITLANMPFLRQLAGVLDDDWFTHPVFDAVASGTIRRNGGHVRLTQLEFQNKGRMALRGEVEIQPNLALGGKVDIGLADAVVEAARNTQLERTFSRSSEGFRWATVTLSGTVATPTDNLGLLLLGAAPDGSAPRKVESTTRPPTFEELTRPR